ncbi:MAG: S-methyl-5-thioribose-1-phosphate isomerase [Lachnospiraceae bacterium]|nr:S-methyl-5-thioribose-1-phosphate isomerase [Lachnospiraceae bacterium]
MEHYSAIDTVALNETEDGVIIIDQTLLPGRTKTIELTELEDMYEAISSLRVRGAPAIGVAAAMGLYVLMKRHKSVDPASFRAYMSECSRRLCSSRPTAVNLAWALGRMNRAAAAAFASADKKRSGAPEDIREFLLDTLKKEALAIRDEDIDACRKMGEYGLSLIKNGSGILTHCNAGRLATVRYGTATAPMYLAAEKGLDIHVFCDETRPLLQGARLTAFELSEAGIETTLICDNMASSLMKAGRIDIIFVGTDRVAANGDVANKIGTSGVAILAKHYGIPFYVCAPLSSIDPHTPTGDDIVIEQRKSSEVTDLWYSERMAPDNAHFSVYNPAFDVTDNSLVTGIITPKGILRPPYSDAIAGVL